MKKIRTRFPFRYWIILLACIYVCLSLFINILQILSSRKLLLNGKVLSNTITNYNRFLIKTPGCQIPYMDAFDYSVKDFIFKERQTICNNNLPALIDSNSTSIFIVNPSIAKYIDQQNTFKCCYQTFTRKEPKYNEDDNNVNYSHNCVPFNQSARIYVEFIKVKCYDNNIMFYQDFFSFVPLKSKKQKTSKKTDKKNLLNVLIIGIDSVSRLNFHRQMPKSVEYLKNLSAVELLGYNKVDDNTFPNLIPVLTGLSAEELVDKCWKDEDDRFDECPFIWKNYKKNGFTTSFGEDASWMGIFNHNRKGFKKQPTDYMWGSFNIISEKLIGNSYDESSVAACVGAREVYKVFLDYIWNFVQKMHTEKLNYFAFYWGASLSHDYLNKPNLGDNDYYNLFKKINESQHLNNTVMIVMSDHGMRFGDFRQIYQGQMEERLPFLFMVLPEWYKRQHHDAYNNLLTNTRRLTTPFDLHETLKDLLHPFQLNAHYWNNLYTSRGYSLFTKISDKRTCEDAGISSHWCMCQQNKEIPQTEVFNVVKSALFAVNFINRQLDGYAQCSNLNLSYIKNTRLMSSSYDTLREPYFKDYMIIFETTPGNALFEATVRIYQLDEEQSNQIEQMEIMGTISRINLYGKQSACISDLHLKLYCYCLNLL